MKRRIIGLLAIALMAGPISSQAMSIVISQVYGGGGNSGATYTNDFVELFNAGSAAVDLSGFSLQYASATGTGSFSQNPVNLFPAFLLQPGQYFLVQAAQGAGGTTPLPSPDGIWSASLSATGGKVALVSGTSGLACNGGSTPCSAAQLALIVDLVGYGNANFFETAAAPALTNTTAAFRAGGGCIDTDNNAADFSTGAPAPRNRGTPRNVCSSTPAPEPGTLALLGLGLFGLGLMRRRVTE
jgi:hypothetical protein